MEMFNKKELDSRIGPLKKDKKLYDLEQVEGYVIRKASEKGLESSYDVMAEEMPYFKTLAYTEYAGCFYLQPLNYKIRNEQMLDAFHDKSNKDIVDYSSWFINRIVNNSANKYSERDEKAFEKYEPKDYLVVLPGSNKVRENVCLNRLKHIRSKHGNNVYFKPHPITTHQIIGELKDFFGEENILPRNINMYYYLQKAKGVYTTHISESAVYSVVMNKDTQPIDVWNNIQRGSFYCINNHLLYNQSDAKNFVNKTFSNYKSGIINPEIDKNWKEKVDKYIDYICAKREKYKGWFVNEAPKR